MSDRRPAQLEAPDLYPARVKGLTPRAPFSIGRGISYEADERTLAPSLLRDRACISGKGRSALINRRSS